MKRWAPLYGLFAKVIGRSMLLYVGTCSLIIILFERLFFQGKMADPKSIAVLPLSISFVALIFGIYWLIPKNYSWLMLVPIPKRQVILLQGLVNVTFVMAVVLSYFSIVAISDLVLVGKSVQFWNTLGAIENSYRSLLKYASQPFGRNPFEPELYEPVFLGGMLACFYLFGSLRNIHRQRLVFSLWSNRAWLKSNSRGITKFFVFVGLCLLSRNYIFSSFGLFALFTFGVAISIPRSWVVSLALAGRSAKVSCIFFLVLGLLQIATVYGFALAKMAGEPESRVQAMLFLGPFGGNPNQIELANLLQSDLSWTSGKKLGGRYLAEFNEGKQLDRGVETKIDFQKLIVSKKTKEGIYAAYQYYEPSTLKLADLQTIYNGLEQTKDDGSDWGVFLRFINAQITPFEIQKLLQSKNKWDITYALLRARYERHPSYTGYVLGNLSRYSGKTLLVALDTLSILRGTRVTLEDWHTFRNGRSIAQSNAEVDCSNYSPGPTAELKSEDVGRLNICLRQRADKTDPYLLRDIETAGWIDAPLTSSGTRIVSRVFPEQKTR